MANRAVNNIKLGAFVLGGLIFLILLLYSIGKNRNLFGSNYALKARFENVQGLVPGNNVRFSGIGIGTVRDIKIIDDTLIEVTMMVDRKMQTVIRKNAMVTIGTDGLVGNKIVNIVPAGLQAPLAVEGDILVSKRAVNTEEMLQTLYGTNNDVAFIASQLKSTIQRINSSSALWGLLNDRTLPGQVKISLDNIRLATAKAASMADDLETVAGDLKKGKGSAGVLLRDTAFAYNLNEAIVKIKGVGDRADSLAAEINGILAGIRQDMNNGNGLVNALFKDSAMVSKLNKSLDNIQQGTDGFNQNMEALKHNFLFRGYFKKLEKEKRKPAGN